MFSLNTVCFLESRADWSLQVLGSRVVLAAHSPLLLLAMEVDREEEVLLLPDFSVAGVRAVLSLLHGIQPQQVSQGWHSWRNTAFRAGSS